MAFKRIYDLRIEISEDVIFIEQGEPNSEDHEVISLCPEMVDILISWLKDSKTEALKFREEQE